MIFSTTNRPNYTNLFCPAALVLCSLATGGTQEMAEGLARRPEGESQIAERGHHRWLGIGVAALKILRKLYSKLFKIFRAITDGWGMGIA